MAKNIQLHIPEPCHENWDQMSPVDKGRFCSSCQKQVVDFSLMSDRQIAEFFKRPSTGSVCGRFMTDQLDREIPIPKKRIPWFRYFFTIALPAFFLTLKSGQARAQGKEKVQEDKDKGRQPMYGDLRTLGMVTRQPSIEAFEKKKPDCEIPVKDTVIRDVMVGKIAMDPETENIRGRVIDRGGKPLEAAMLQVKGKSQATFTDKEGRYSIRMNPMDTLVVTAVSYQPMELVPGRAGAGELILEEAERFLAGEVMIVPTVTAGSFRAQVTDDSGNPVPYASITLDNKQVIQADENGYFELNAKQCRKNKELRVSAAGFVSRNYQPAEGRTGKGIEVIQLSRNEWLPEVVLTNGIAMGMIKRKSAVTGAVVCTTSSQNTVQENKGTTTPLPADIILYPNPVQAGGTLTLQTSFFEQGYYRVQIVNTAGQLLYNREAWIDKGAGNFSLVLPSIPAGSYFLRLQQKGTARNWSQKISVQ